LILVAAGGIFLLQISLWTYFAFNAVTREKPGRLRLRGVPYALQQAENWSCRISTDIIRKHYLYPEPAPLYTRPRPENSDDLMIRGIKEAEQFRQSLLISDTSDRTHLQSIAEAIVTFISDESVADQLADAAPLDGFRNVTAD